MSSIAYEFLSMVRDTIAAQHLLSPNEPVLIAVSGGPDSMALSHALMSLGHRTEIAHLDHLTRNGESTRDASFVQAWAEHHKLPFHLRTAPVEKEAEQSPLSFEEFAREARYRFLLDTAIERGFRVIATGHTADDQAETVLMRLLRGASPSGLAGIRPQRVERDIRIVRPLIACKRAEVLAFLQDLSIEYCIDSSNDELVFQRNQIRHELIPMLEAKFNPRIRHALVRLGEIQLAEDAWLTALVDAFLARCVMGRTIDRAKFREGPVACQRRAIASLAWEHGVVCPFERIECARIFVASAPTGKSYDLGGGIRIKNGRSASEIVLTDTPVDETVVPLAHPGTTLAFGTQVAIRTLDAAPTQDLKTYCTPRRQVFDGDALGGQLLVRYRRAGDTISPLGMQGTRKVKSVLIDRGVPAWERDSIPMIVAQGRIAWIVGHVCASDFAVSPSTKRIVEIEVGDAIE